MPQEGESSSTPETDIWHNHEPIIRKLYLEEKKTLKRVKEIMESEHGFPSFPLSTYGTKLRDQLELPKKLKKKDWPVVYQHYQQRQAEGKETNMYLNGTFIPWKKAWKEIRRYRVPLNSTVRAPLPRGVVLRTPPPIQSPIRNNAAELNWVPPESQNFQNVSNIENESCGLLPFHHQLSLMCLENTPWFVMRKALLGETGPTGPEHTIIPHRRLFRRGTELQIENSNMINSSALTLSVPSSRELSTQLDPFHILAQAVYTISNYLMILIRPYLGDPLQELLDLLFARIPQRLVPSLFDSTLLSIQATWDGIGRNIHLIKRQDTFISWMKLVLKRPIWIMRHGHLYLAQAVSMGCIDIVHSLLKLGVRADEEFKEFTNVGSLLGIRNRPPIYEATASQDTKCLELLVKSCDTNRTIFTVLDGSFSNFSLVLFSMTKFFKNQGLKDNGWELEIHQPSLKVLLEHGANVDLPRPESLTSIKTVRPFLEAHALHYTRMSLLEHCYYYDKQIYYQLAPFSSRPPDNIYRDEVCIVAAQGHSALLDYFTSKPCVNPLVLGSVLAEQFFLGDRFFDSTVVRALLEFGVTINTSAPEECFTTLLRLILRKTRNVGFNENDVYIMKALLSSGAVLNSEVLAAAVANEGIGALGLISALGANFRREGARALCRAARLNNFFAVSWLLHEGIDINAAIEESHHPLEFASSVSIIVAAVIICEPELYPRLYEDVVWDWGGSADCIMLRFLLDHGAELWAGSPDTSPFEALRVILHNSYRDPHLFEKVHILLNHGMELQGLPRFGFYLLEASLMDSGQWSEINPRSKVFKLLREHGAPAYPGGVLTRLISCHAPRQLVLDLIDSGADITAHATTFHHGGYYDPIQIASQCWDQKLVLALLEHDADINSPALMYSGRTPLQAACMVASDSEESDRTQMDFVRFLLRNNVDVNAPAGAKYGFTALQLAANGGNLQLLSLLLSHGALVNMPNHSMRKCALDCAAANGRLDALHFLLKAGAMSYCHGQSGYEGAIRLARKRGFFVLVDSLNEHVRKNEILFREQPTLAVAHCAAMKDRDWTDDMFSEIWFSHDVIW
ncbi:hypothetical protein F4679DRAFT_555375 [Xylaria curta]|nr:hypothetical protein F4679DRAFT_555375 [Xylaria curta]